ncbi:MAG: NDP-sugar synthase [Actinobacteria bacterium]|nr:NDP-sugar synthase [Actinomycetota bacterium]
MRAVVLVGGFGTRLRPLTASRPKQMLPIVHRPMLEHVLEHLATHAVDEAVLSMGYRPDVFRDAYPSGRHAGVRLHYAVEDEPLDTAGAIRFAALDAGIDERFVVVNGDVLTDLDVTRLVRFHAERGAEATIALHRVEDPSAFGVVPTDADGRVRAFVEKPPPGEAPTDLINAGTYVLESSVIDRIPAARPVSMERATFPALVADGRLFAMPGDTYWIDAGTPAKYIEAQLDLVHGRRGGCWRGVHPDAKVAAGATVTGSVVGPGAVVEDGAVVRSAVVLGGARVASGATVADSVVGPGAVVGVGAEVLEGSVLGDEAVVEDCERLAGQRRPDVGAT